MVNIAFMSNQLGERGTEVAMYDYAHYNEKFLGNTSIILHYKNHYFNSDKAIEKFKNRFKVFAIIEKEEVDNILKENNIDIFYYEHGGGILRPVIASGHDCRRPLYQWPASRARQPPLR